MTRVPVLSNLGISLKAIQYSTTPIDQLSHFIDYFPLRIYGAIKCTSELDDDILFRFCRYFLVGKSGNLILKEPLLM